MFLTAHGPGYQVLFLIDNSQGHLAYLTDALLALHCRVFVGEVVTCLG